MPPQRMCHISCHFPIGASVFNCMHAEAAELSNCMLRLWSHAFSTIIFSVVFSITQPPSEFLLSISLHLLHYKSHHLHYQIDTLPSSSHGFVHQSISWFSSTSTSLSPVIRLLHHRLWETLIHMCALFWLPLADGEAEKGPFLRAPQQSSSGQKMRGFIMNATGPLGCTYIFLRRFIWLSIL